MHDFLTLRDKDPHLSRLALDRVLAGERRGLAEAHAHLLYCPRCQQHLADLRHSQRDAMSHPARSARITAIRREAARAGERHGRRPRWPWARLKTLIFLPTAALAGAAAALLIWVAPAPGPQPGLGGTIPAVDTIRVKGAEEGLHVLVSTEGGQRAVGLDERLPVGSRLAFQMRCPNGCWVVLVTVSQLGAPQLLQHSTAAPWRLQPLAQLQTLPVGAAQDRTPGAARLVAFRCAAPPSSAAALRAVGRSYPRGADGQRDVSDERAVALAGCTTSGRIMRAAQTRARGRERPP